MAGNQERKGGEIDILINGNTATSGEDQIRDKITGYMADQGREERGKRKRIETRAYVGDGRRRGILLGNHRERIHKISERAKRKEGSGVG